MIRRCVILFSMLYLCIQLSCQAQNTNTSQASQMFITRGWVYKGDTIPWIQLRTVPAFDTRRKEGIAPCQRGKCRYH